MRRCRVRVISPCITTANSSVRPKAIPMILVKTGTLKIVLVTR
jgi:hypothetical protein